MESLWCYSKIALFCQLPQTPLWIHLPCKDAMDNSGNVLARLSLNSQMQKHSWWKVAPQSAEEQTVAKGSGGRSSRIHRRHTVAISTATASGLAERRDWPVRVSSTEAPPLVTATITTPWDGVSKNRLLRLEEETPSVSGSVSGFEFGSPIGRKVVESACLIRVRK